MDADALVAALRQKIDEEERAATAAPSTSATWTLVVEPNDDGWTDAQIAQFIVRWDPARVLRLVAAHRKILDLHTPIRVRGLWSEVNQVYDVEIVCPMCVWIGDDEDRGGNRFRYLEHAEAPCETLLALAEVYGLEDSTEEPGDG